MKKYLLFIFILFLFPLSVLAYSNQIYVGGNTIGIEVHSDGVYIVGFYSVFGKEIAKDAGFQIGYLLISIDEKEIHSIDSLNQLIQEEKEYSCVILRNHRKIHLELPVLFENHSFKTGLYVKDQVYGIGTLSYIDPEYRIYGSLGHEILESSSMKKFEIKEGAIYSAEVNSIRKSNHQQTGSLNAEIDSSKTIGDISINQTEGVFGTYIGDLSSYRLMSVGEKEEIQKGKAYLRTSLLEGKTDDYLIDIMLIREDSDSQNILFQIRDNRLLEQTGGIVQGMSGSPIIQDDKIIGVVNYVIVEEPDKGYGIFITNMLEKGDQIYS